MFRKQICLIRSCLSLWDPTLLSAVTATPVLWCRTQVPCGEGRAVQTHFTGREAEAER